MVLFGAVGFPVAVMAMSSAHAQAVATADVPAPLINAAVATAAAPDTDISRQATHTKTGAGSTVITGNSNANNSNADSSTTDNSNNQRSYNTKTPLKLDSSNPNTNNETNKKPAAPKNTSTAQSKTVQSNSAQPDTKLRRAITIAESRNILGFSQTRTVHPDTSASTHQTTFLTAAVNTDALLSEGHLVAASTLIAADASSNSDDASAIANANANSDGTNTEADSQPIGQPISQTITPITADNAASQTTADTDIPTDLAASDENDDDIVASLNRLAEFYQLRPNNEALPAIENNTIVRGTNLTWKGISTHSQNLSSDTKITRGTPLVAKTDIQQEVAAQDYEAESARCEGQWYYPQTNPDYEQAVQRAQTQDGLDISATGLPIYAQADYGYYDNQNYAELSGNVIIDQGSQHIEAEEVVLDLQSRVAGVQGDVLFTTAGADAEANNTGNSINNAANQGGLIGVANSMTYNTDTEQATAYDVAFASVPLQAHGYAKRLNKPNDTQYQLDKVMFSTCPPTDRKWRIDAESIDIDTETGRGEAYDTTFRIADVPVFYLPYFNFPIDDRRSSGFLIPNAGFDTDNGLDIEVPYYFNLAPNYDATLTTHIYSNRNPMLSGEFRYLTEDFGYGKIQGSYLPNDRKYDDEDRKSLYFDHYWASKAIPHLSADATYNYVSDEDYLDDFDTLGLSDNTLNLPRRARVNYYNDYLNGELKVETFQTLDAFTITGDRIEDKDKPYSRLPQFTLDYRLPWFDEIEVTGEHDSAYFKKSIEDGSEAEKAAHACTTSSVPATR